MACLGSRTMNWSATKLSLILKPCSHLQHFQFSKGAGSFTVTYENLLSDENKLRAQKKLGSEPPVRTTKEYRLKQGYRYASVLVPLCTVHGEPALLFTLRSSQLQKHRGEVSFPGGNEELSDKDATQTALRETQEELGLDPSSFDVWGPMSSLPGSLGRKMVSPILARTGEVDLANLKFNHSEVEEVFVVSIRHLCDPRNVGSTRFCTPGLEYTCPVYLGAQHRIWGLTAVIVHQVLSIVAPGLYNFKLKHRKPVYGTDLVGKEKKSSRGSKES